MRTENGISLEFFNTADPDCAVLTAELQGGSHLVRMPGGQFKVRILTPHPTDVVMSLDRQNLVQCQVPAGLSYIEKSQDGKPFIFNPSGAPVQLSPQVRAAAESLEKEPGPGRTEIDGEELVTDFLADAIASGVQLTPTNVATEFMRHQVKSHGMNDASDEQTEGRLIVALRFVPQDKVETEIEHVVCRLNEPDRHDRLFAANFHKVVSPVAPTPHTCSLCRLHQHD